MTKDEIEIKQRTLEIDESFEYESSLWMDDGRVPVHYVVTRREIPSWWDQDEMPIEKCFELDCYLNGEKLDEMSGYQFTSVVRD
jgi:hypothetical protein